VKNDYEQEGHDRPHMALPFPTDTLITSVLDANPRTVIVIQSGTPVSMPWLPQAHTILQAWYGGNETGNAIADVLFGTVNPSGKLPLSFPVRCEDNPAYLNYRAEGGRVLYGEDVYVGYRFYDATSRPTAFPFGHGLSYTNFDLSGLSIIADPHTDQLKATLAIQNTGSIPGAEVVQVYVSQRRPSIKRPPKELKGFEKVFLEPGEAKRVEIVISLKYATSFWDEGRDAWVMEQDAHEVLVGTSSVDVRLSGNFEIAETRWWRGL
jgi:beta-glucosidase